MLNMMQWILGWVKSNAKLLVKPNKNFLPLRTFIERSFVECGCDEVLALYRIKLFLHWIEHYGS
jgi:hypothetical protein